MNNSRRVDWKKHQVVGAFFQAYFTIEKLFIWLLEFVALIQSQLTGLMTSVTGRHGRKWSQALRCFTKDRSEDLDEAPLRC